MYIIKIYNNLKILTEWIPRFFATKISIFQETRNWNFCKCSFEWFHDLEKLHGNRYGQRSFFGASWWCRKLCVETNLNSHDRSHVDHVRTVRPKCVIDVSYTARTIFCYALFRRPAGPAAVPLIETGPALYNDSTRRQIRISTIVTCAARQTWRTARANIKHILSVWRRGRRPMTSKRDGCDLPSFKY